MRQSSHNLKNSAKSIYWI